MRIVDEDEDEAEDKDGDEDAAEDIDEGADENEDAPIKTPTSSVSIYEIFDLASEESRFSLSHYRLRAPKGENDITDLFSLVVESSVEHKGVT